MAQSGSFSLGNVPGATFRGNLNTILAALQSTNSGSTAPTSTAPGMLWFDTTAPGVWKYRNTANNAWLLLFADDAVTNAKLSNMATARLKGRVAAGTGDPEDLTVLEVQTLLGIPELTLAEVQNPNSTVFGRVSGQRLAQAGSLWTYSAVTASTSGSAIDFSSLPAGITAIDLFFEGVSLNAANHLLVQLGTGGTPTTTGYVRGISSVSGNAPTAVSTAGIPIFCNTAADIFDGILEIRKKPTANDWVAKGQFTQGAFTIPSNGFVALAGVLNILRVTRITSGDFDAGNIWIRYK